MDDMRRITGSYQATDCGIATDCSTAIALDQGAIIVIPYKATDIAAAANGTGAVTMRDSPPSHSSTGKIHAIVPHDPTDAVAAADRTGAAAAGHSAVVMPHSTAS